MLLVLASRHDSAAATLVERWRELDARLLTCRDLSTAGWRFCPHEPHLSRAVVGGQIVNCAEIAGVLTRLPSVLPDELPHIVAADRSYVAAEMNAFLTAWLSAIPCTVINRPTASCLMGPNWRQEQWVHAAARAGLRTRALKFLLKPGNRPTESMRDSSVEASECVNNSNETDGVSPVLATVVGSRCFGAVDGKLAARALRLAAKAGVELLDVQFSSPDADASFVGAYLGTDISRAHVADALLNCFQECAELAT
jgi:hypothetical protein